MADLVIAAGPFTTFPGGVIALKCDEWMAGARGTLTSGSDSLACTGTFVNDTQTVATSIRDDVFTAYTEADDTLEIPFTDIPIEVDLAYAVFLSYRVPGEWDVTNTDTLVDSTNHRFAGVVACGFHGIAGSAPDENDPMISFEAEGQAALARVPHYVTEPLGSLLGIFDAQTDDTMFVRAFAQSGTTAEWLLDQLIFIPNLANYFGPPINGWDSEDFSLALGGSWNINPTATLAIADGADGGDANGKFTWIIAPRDMFTGGISAGGDYQKKADSGDAEYVVRVDEADGFELINSGSGGEATAHGYSLTGVNFREAQEWTNDDFSRTVTIGAGNGWGNSPEGYGWVVGGSVPLNHTGVDGSVGIHRYISGLLSGNLNSMLGGANNAVGAQLELFDQYEYSGTWRINAGAWTTGSTSAKVHIRLREGNMLWSIIFDPIAETWKFGYTHGTFTDLTGDIDISSWYGGGSTVGWRIEVLRYVIRVRVWDASGSEPSTWDYEDFRQLDVATPETYPYSDDPISAQGAYTYVAGVEVLTEVNLKVNAEVVDFEFDNIVVEHDSYGTPDDGGTSIEQPDGNEIDSLTIPWGAGYWVYWATRDWTAPDSGTFNLALSSKVWNAEGTADLQRTDVLLFYFRTVHGNIVPMNWRSADRAGATTRRVLVGTP